MKTKYVLAALAFGLALTFALVWALEVEAEPTAATVPSAEIHVCTQGPPTCQYATIQEAVDAAIFLDTIKVAAGTYQSLDVRPGTFGPAVITQVVYITQNLTIQGGYTITDWLTSDLEANPTIIDASGGGRGVYIHGVGGVPIEVTLSGLKITNGDATGLGPFAGADYGGGVYANNVQLTVEDCEIYNNKASTQQGGNGGGLYLAFGNGSRLERNKVYSNTSVTASATGSPQYGHGGGVVLINSNDLVLEDNEVYGNLASGYEDNAFGGGIEIRYCDTVKLLDNRIHGNQAASQEATGMGGGLYAYASHSVDLQDNVIYDNLGSDAKGGAYGGGVGFNQSDGDWYRNSIIRNTASISGAGDGGGVDINTYSHVDLSDSTINDNYASRDGPGDGGGLSITNSDVHLARNSITNNKAGDNGGGVYIAGPVSKVLMHDNDIALNAAATQVGARGYGGGLYLSGVYTVLVSDNSITSNAASENHSGYGGGVYVAGGTPTLLNNKIVENVASDTSYGYGGGVAVENSQPLLDTNEIRLNTASAATGAYLKGYGGGVYIAGGTPELLDNEIMENVASDTSYGYGGGVVVENSQPILSANVIQLNTACAATSVPLKGYGGGVCVLGSPGLTLTNNIIAQNVAGAPLHYGDGVYVGEHEYGQAAFATLLHNTVADNGDEGVYIEHDSSIVELVNTIVAGHAIAGVAMVDNGLVTTEATLWHGNGVDTIGAVISMTDRYGDPVFDGNGDYYIGKGSAAIDKGVNAGVAIDIDKNLRPLDGGYDIGADEYTGVNLRRYTTKKANPQWAKAGAMVTFMITLHNSGAVSATNVVLSDTIPISTTYVPGSLQVNSGEAVTTTGGITWTGTITPGHTVTLMFQVVMQAEIIIKNEAIVIDQYGTITMLEAWVNHPRYSKYEVYLPLVIR